MTFADLMSLLLAFFVLLFSFSEMDRKVYKEIAGSMQNAFGVQREIKSVEPPKGINIIAREFSPGKPEPTPLNQVRQSTTEDFHRHPVFTDPSERGQENQQENRIKIDGKAIRVALDEEITHGLIELETKDKRIILRIKEKASFPSGSETLIKPFENIAQKIGNVFSGFEGQIIVSGHTDNYPINTRRFRSNWELSASRAVSVIHALKSNDELKHKNYQVAAYADTHPVDNNETVLGRARNRRVEIMFDYTKVSDSEPGTAVSVEDSSLSATEKKYNPVDKPLEVNTTARDSDHQLGGESPATGN